MFSWGGLKEMKEFCLTTQRATRGNGHGNAATDGSFKGQAISTESLTCFNSRLHSPLRSLRRKGITPFVLASVRLIPRTFPREHDPITDGSWTNPYIRYYIPPLPTPHLALIYRNRYRFISVHSCCHRTTHRHARAFKKWPGVVSRSRTLDRSATGDDR